MPTPYRWETDDWDSWTYAYNTQATYYTTSTRIWNDWNVAWSQTTTGTTNQTTLMSDTWSTWGQWNDRYTYGTRVRTYRDHLWNNWVQVGNAQPVIATPVYTSTPVRTDAEWAAIRQENERLRAERDKLQAVARVEARKLLEFVLTKEQVASYDKHKFFDVVGSAGTTFRIHHGTSGNVRQLVNGREVNALCAHPSLYDQERKSYLPTEDCLAAQALAIMHDESSFLAVANVHYGPRHRAAVRVPETAAA